MRARQTIVSAGIAVLMSAAVLAAPPDKGDAGFLGFSSADAGTVNGGVGLAGMNQKCVDTYGDGARICTSEEVIKSSALAQPAGTYAWVHPTFVKLKRQLAERSMDRYSMTDASGWERATAVLFSCNGWLSDAADDAGLVLDSELRFLRLIGGADPTDCNSQNYVACCR